MTRLVPCPAGLAVEILGPLAVLGASVGVVVDAGPDGLTLEGPDGPTQALAEGARQFVGDLALRATMGAVGDA